MRWIGIVVVVVIAILAYQFFRSDNGQQVAEQAGDAADQAAETVQEAAEATAEATQEAAEKVEDTAEQAAEATGDAAEQLSAALTVGDVDLGKELSGVIDSTAEALGGITDAASAETALPTLQELGTKLDGLTATVDQLPEDAKKVLASVLGAALPTLQSTVDEVSAIEGVGDIVKPALDAIMAKLDGWAQQPA